jgi:hypothetical protein
MIATVTPHHVTHTPPRSTRRKNHADRFLEPARLAHAHHLAQDQAQIEGRVKEQ